MGEESLQDKTKDEPGVIRVDSTPKATASGAVQGGSNTEHRIISSVYSSETNKPLDEKEEEAFIMSHAFRLAAARYFKKRAGLEEDWKHLKSELKKVNELRRNGRNSLIFLAVMGLMLIAAGAITLFLIVAFVGIIIVMLGFLFQNYYNKLASKFENKTHNMMIALKNHIDSLKPEKKISFISKIYLPFYIVPYKNGSFIFDAVGGGKDIEMKTVNLRTTDILNDIENVNTNIGRYENMIASGRDGEGMIPTDILKNYDNASFEKKAPELPIARSLEILNGSTYRDHWVESKISVQVHKPDSGVGQSIQAILADLRAQQIVDSAPPNVPIRFDVQDALDLRRVISGVDAESAREDISEVVNDMKKRLDSSLTLVCNRLRSNISIVSDTSNLINTYTKEASTMNLCQHCFQDAHGNLADKYEMNKYIESEFSEVGIIDALTNDTTAKIPMSRDKALEMIRSGADISLRPKELVYGLAKMKRLHPSITGAYMCERCGNVDSTIPLTDFIVPVSLTGKELYYEVTQPIKEKSLATKTKGVEIRRDWKTQNLLLLPYKEMSGELEFHNKMLQRDIQSASHIMEIAGRD